MIYLQDVAMTSISTHLLEHEVCFFLLDTYVNKATSTFLRSSSKLVKDDCSKKAPDIRKGEGIPLPVKKPVLRIERQKRKNPGWLI